jgi:C-terminal processing protease CtpA/Prc
MNNERGVKDDRVQRLQTLADIWGKVWLFHPAVVTEDIDWNQVLVKAIPEVEAAKTSDELAARINERLLKPLNDPMSYALHGEETGNSDGGPLSARKLSDSTGYIRVPAGQDRVPTLHPDFQQAYEGLGAVKRLVVDLRWDTAPEPDVGISTLLQFFARRRLPTGPLMRRVFHGWSERDREGAGYRQSWDITPGGELATIREPTVFALRLCPGTDFSALATITVPTVFLVNRASCPGLYQCLDALQTQPGIAVVFEPSGPAGTGETAPTRYPEGIVVQLNTTRLLGYHGQTAFRPDVIAEHEITRDEMPTIAEQALAARPGTQGQLDGQAILDMKFAAPLTEPKESLPREERLLGLFRIWNVVRYFDPNLEFCDMDWHSCLPEWIPRFEAAEKKADYVRQLSMLAAHLHDSHVSIAFPGLPGMQALPVKFGWVEDRVVVTGVPAESGVNPALEVGDELVEFDGKSVAEQFAGYRSRVSSSTEGSFLGRACVSLSFGPAGSEVGLAVRRQGQTVRLTMRRTMSLGDWLGFSATVSGEPGYRLLDGNLGYVNLQQLGGVAELDRAFEALRDSGGLIIDDRGYPGYPPTWDLVARLCGRPVKSTIFEIPVVSGSDQPTRAWEIIQYEVPPHPKVHYRKPVVVLINDKAMSNSEDLCVYLRNAERVTFVGSPTAGTNGEVTFLSLPGGGRIGFTGMRAKYADGSRFQNIGILPDVPAAPTIAGVKSGRDEVLEKGIEVLKELILGAGGDTAHFEPAPRGTRNEDAKEDAPNRDGYKEVLNGQHQEKPDG